jgi:hypothetical protein
MAKPVVVTHFSATSSFQLSRLKRRKLDGAKRRMSVASAGQACTRDGLTDDGAALIRDGLTLMVARWRPGRSEPRTAMAHPFHRCPPPWEKRWISRGHCPPPTCQSLPPRLSTAWSPNPLTIALLGHFSLANSGGFPSISEPTSFLVGMLIELRFRAPNAPPLPLEVAGTEDDRDFEML